MRDSRPDIAGLAADPAINPGVVIQAPPTVDFGPPRVAELINKISDAADKLAKDRTSRGDLKILSRTLRELRYAFKVFAPIGGCRKVTIFGSARTPPHQPAYQQAIEFSRQDGRARVDGHYPRRPAARWRRGTPGAGREHAMGLNILLPFEQAANRPSPAIPSSCT